MSRGPVFVERSGIATCAMVCSVLVLVVLVPSGLPVLAVLVLVLVRMLAAIFLLVLLNWYAPAAAGRSRRRCVSCVRSFVRTALVTRLAAAAP